MPRPRIALVLTQDKGGPVDVTVSLARQLADNGHEVALFGPKPARDADVVHDILRVTEVPSKTDVSAMRESRHQITNFRPDVVHAQDRRAGLLCSALGGVRRGPVVVHTYHGVPDDVEMDWLTSGTGARPSRYTLATLAADSLVARTVDHTVVVAPMMKTFLVNRLRVPASRVTHLDNGLFLPPENPSSTVRRLIFVGMLIRRKGVQHLLDALALVQQTHPDISLDIVGDGPERENLQGQVARLGLQSQVSFLGFRTDVHQLLAASDAFVLPSTMEQQPLVLIEAMAAGKAVIATDAGGVADMLKSMGEAARVVPVGDHHQMASALEHLCAMPDLKRSTTAMVKRTHERFSIERCAKNHQELYLQLLSDRRPGR